MRYLAVSALLCAALLPGCMIPNTYYDPVDPYARGRRWYDRGRPDLAAQDWDPLVEKGDCDAEFWVGMLYFFGQAKPQDYDRAIALWRKAADGNHPKAQGALGDLYYQNAAVVEIKCASCGVEKDLVRAYLWYRLLERSARYDGEEAWARTMLGKIRLEMTPAQIAEGDRLVQEWKPTPKDCEPRHWW
jgi:hypothetical protein